MIPIYLKLKGIYSYQDKEQLIDFQHLCDASLFGIFGPVGSGKSTILESISFALYGETERLNKRENRGYNMMNLKSDNLLIDFVFRNGTDEEEYRFIVKGRRNSKNFDDVKTFDREAFKKEQKEWLPISADSAEEITGLNYTNFRRTIIIPQGRFQEFLQLGDTDRTKMMKELFQLGRFDLSGKTKLLEEKNNSRLTNLEGQLLQLTEVSKGKITEIEKELKLLKSEIEKNQKKQKEKEKNETEFKVLKELFEKIALFENELNELNVQKSTIEGLKKRLKEYQYCQVHFKSKIEKLRENKNRSETLESELKKSKLQFNDLSTQLEKLEVEFEGLKEKFDVKEELKKEADAYEKLLKIKHLKIDAENLQNRIEKGEITLNDCANKIERLEEEQKNTKVEAQQLKDNEIDMVELAKIKAWFSEINSFKKELNELENQITENGKKKERKSIELKQLLSETGFEVDEFDISEIEKFYQAELTHLEMEQEKINDELKHLKVKQELSQYSESLKEGDACPVCGSTHHPQKMQTLDLSALNKKIEEELMTAKGKFVKLSNSEKQAGVKMSEYQSAELLLSELKDKRKVALENVERHQKTYSSETKYQEYELEKQFEKAQRDKIEMGRLEKHLSQTELALSKEQKNKGKYQKTINQIETDLAAKKASYDTLFQQIKMDDADKAIELEDEELKNKIESLTNDYHQIVKNYELADTTIKKMKPEKDKLNGVIETKGKDFENLSVEITNDEEGLNNEIRASKYNSLKDISKILAQDYELELEEGKIQTFENKLFSVNEQLQKLKQQSDNKYFDNEKFLLLQQELEQLKNVINQQNKQLGSLENDKKEQENKLGEKEKLTKEFDSLSLRAGNIKILKNLFKASGFVNYVSSVYLQNLINAANDRFSALTGQKLRLELTETNDFIIRDYLNEGKTRSVKTLSGGQTFQASLSLALALADNIQSMSKSENNFFFLDEGFGSLDKESLAVVFQSLKSLRKEKRVVGVISHVEELQQEIESYLKIENEPETGSKIIRSWE